MNITLEIREAYDLLVYDAESRGLAPSNMPALEKLRGVLDHLESNDLNIVLRMRTGFDIVFTPADVAAEPPVANRIGWVRWYRDKTGASLTESMAALSRRETFGSLHALQGHV